MQKKIKPPDIMSAKPLEHNAMVAPSILGDPVTAFNIDARRGYLVTGSAMGRVSAWPIPHLVPPVMVDSVASPSLSSSTIAVSMEHKEIARLRVLSAAQNAEFWCIPLAKGSDEGIRSIFFFRDQICALIGDIHVKIWPSFDDGAYQLIKYRRHHLPSTCPVSFPLQHGPNILILTATDDPDTLGYQMNLETGDQETFPLHISKRALPVFYDTERLVVSENNPGGAQSVRVYRASTRDQLMHFPFERANRHYWGFQLVGSLMAYVSNYRTLKVVTLDKGDLVHRMPHTMFVVTFIFEPAVPSSSSSSSSSFSSSSSSAAAQDANSYDLFTLCSDRSISWWRDGQLARRFTDLAGEVGSKGYPHILRRHGHFLFYSADDGVYYVDLEAPDS